MIKNVDKWNYFWIVCLTICLAAVLVNCVAELVVYWSEFFLVVDGNIEVDILNID